MLTLTTPGLLFPAISLLLLAYTNRFLAIASLIRTLHARYREAQDPLVRRQIVNLRLRLRLIRDMQFLGIISFFMCVLCMYLIFREWQLAANYVFISSLLLLMVSLAMSAYEIHISTRALHLQLEDLDN